MKNRDAFQSLAANAHCRHEHSMASFSERKMQRLKGVLDAALLQCTESERAEMQAYMNKSARAAQTNSDSLFLKLPAEIKNNIYEMVAADAHAKCVTTKLEDANGVKVRPGLLGVCKSIRDEFHSVFYSQQYITAGLFDTIVDGGATETAKDPKLLDAMVNRKYGCEQWLAYPSVQRLEQFIEGMRQHTLWVYLKSPDSTAREPFRLLHFTSRSADEVKGLEYIKDWYIEMQGRWISKD